MCALCWDVLSVSGGSRSQRSGWSASVRANLRSSGPCWSQILHPDVWGDEQRWWETCALHACMQSLYIYIELFTCSLYICNLNSVFPPRCQNNRPASQGAEQRGGFPANVTTNTAKTSKLQSTCTMFNVHLLFQLLLEKQSLLNPLGRVFGIRKQYRKRAGNSECFWKYCV